jgi:hypothetical protein
MKARIQHNDPNANLELISKRHSAFNSSIGPVNDIMSKLEKLVTINAERPLDSVTRAIFNEIDEKLFGHRIELPKAVQTSGAPHGFFQLSNVKPFQTRLDLPESLNEKTTVYATGINR